MADNGKIAERSYGIDALKLFCMYLVTVLHVLGQGGVLEYVTGAKYTISWIIEICAYPCVNIFAMVTGYLNYSDKEKPFRYSKYVSLWLQVAFYSVLLQAGGIFLGWAQPVSIFESFLPVFMNRYWYFTAYTFVFFLIPFINKALRGFTNREANCLVTVLAALFSVLVYLSGDVEKVAKLGYGYTALWIILMYIMGAWIKKTGLAQKVKNTHAALGIAVSLLVTIAHKFISDMLGNKAVICYVMPTFVVISVLMICVFVKMRFSEQVCRRLASWSPAAFGVFLIHVHPLVWEHVIENGFVKFSGMPILQFLLLCVLAGSVSIFVVCLLIEKARLWLFRFSGIDRRAEKMCECVISAVSKRINK